MGAHTWHILIITVDLDNGLNSDYAILH